MPRFCRAMTPLACLSAAFAVLMQVLWLRSYSRNEQIELYRAFSPEGVNAVECSAELAEGVLMLSIRHTTGPFDPAPLGFRRSVYVHHYAYPDCGLWGCFVNGNGNMRFSHAGLLEFRWGVRSVATPSMSAITRYASVPIWTVEVAFCAFCITVMVVIRSGSAKRGPRGFAVSGVRRGRS
jgi:hypothetical protein